MALLSFNPFVMIQIAAICQTLIMIVIVSNLGKITCPNRTIQFIYIFFKDLFSSIYAIIGILFLDTSLTWLFGSWTYADWNYHIPSVIIVFILGIEYLLVGLLKRPNILDILFIIVFSIGFIIIVNILTANYDVMSQYLENTLPVFLGISLLFITVKCSIKGIFAVKDARNDSFINRTIWNISTFAQKLSNTKYNLIIWIFTVSQGILCFLGYSILTIWLHI